MNLINYSLYCIIHSLLIITLACSPRVKDMSFPKITISIPPGMPIKEKEMVQILERKLGPPNNTKKYRVELLIVSYTSGKEIFSLSDKSNDDVTVNRTRGSIEAMIKIRALNKIQKVHFIRATGRTKDEITDNLIGKIKEVLD